MEWRLAGSLTAISFRWHCLIVTPNAQDEFESRCEQYLISDVAIACISILLSKRKCQQRASDSGIRRTSLFACHIRCERKNNCVSTLMTSKETNFYWMTFVWRYSFPLKLWFYDVVFAVQSFSYRPSSANAIQRLFVDVKVQSRNVNESNLPQSISDWALARSPLATSFSFSMGTISSAKLIE